MTLSTGSLNHFCSFTPDLLFYSWRILKLLSFKIFGCYVSASISNFWLFKVAYLVRNNKYNYNFNKNIIFFNGQYSGKIFLTNSFRFKVIELAFIILLRPSFEKFFVDFLLLNEYL